MMILVRVRTNPRSEDAVVMMLRVVIFDFLYSLILALVGLAAKETIKRQSSNTQYSQIP